ncbi:MAG: OsmC family protein [Rhodopseudomonas palustris]|nr:OsmC family protein [Rhodopseudomonas palustris]
MGIVAEREKIDLTGMRITVQKEMSAEPPRRIARLTTRIVMPKGLTEQQKAKLEKAAHTCPVHQTLQGNVELPIEFVYPYAVRLKNAHLCVVGALLSATSAATYLQYASLKDCSARALRLGLLEQPE